MFSRTFSCLLLVFAFARASAAQQTVDVGSVSGRVVDASGGAIPGATVTITHQATNVAASEVTERDGRFRFPYLRIGTYDLRVTVMGFNDATRQLTLSAGS